MKGAVAALNFVITSAAKYDVEDHILIQEIQHIHNNIYTMWKGLYKC